jgi:hypothetical protein
MRQSRGFFQVSGCHVQNKTHSAGDSFEIPDMGNRGSQLNVAHPFPSDFGFGNFYAALVADDSLVANLFVFSAVAFPVLLGSENLFAEKAVGFWFEGSVVNGLRFLTSPLDQLNIFSVEARPICNDSKLFNS